MISDRDKKHEFIHYITPWKYRFSKTSMYDVVLRPGCFFVEDECLFYINSEPNEPNVLECKDKMINEI